VGKINGVPFCEKKTPCLAGERRERLSQPTSEVEQDCLLQGGGKKSQRKKKGERFGPLLDRGNKVRPRGRGGKADPTDPEKGKTANTRRRPPVKKGKKGEPAGRREKKKKKKTTARSCTGKRAEQPLSSKKEIGHEMGRLADERGSVSVRLEKKKEARCSLFGGGKERLDNGLRSPQKKKKEISNRGSSPKNEAKPFA